MREGLPTLVECAAGVLLHDIGKLLQRAHGRAGKVDAAVEGQEPVILPVHQGRYSHRHALWTEQFFRWMETNGLSFPAGINRNAVRDMAVFHHNPKGIGWLAAAADRLSAGIERKARDEEAESAYEGPARERYIKTALQSPFSMVRLGLGDPRRSEFPLGALSPDGEMPRERANTDEYPQRYERLWGEMQKELRRILELNSAELFCESLLSVSERYLYAVPSSTVDQPDISLHDHSRVAAALAGALYAWHEAGGTLEDEGAIRDLGAAKFRMVAGDLSGIQPSLFQLASQQVRGVNRILRARSFLFGALAEAAALRCRRELGLPIFNLVQNAGGRFLLLAADVPGVEEKVRAVRREVDEWMYGRYVGTLALHLAVSEPFSGEDLMRERFRALMGRILGAAERAKLRAFEGVMVPVHRNMDYQKGACSACGVRPAVEAEAAGDGDAIWRCRACHDESRLGRALPHAAAIGWREKGPGGDGLTLFGGLRLEVLDETPHSATGYVSLSRVYGGEGRESPYALRFLANYAPRLREEEVNKRAYVHLPEEARQTGVGEMKTFEHLALDGLEEMDGGLAGEDLLAVLKADVDRLGLIFGMGLQDLTLSRFASLSRMMDFFFTARLTELLRKEFRETYTVYAGGDDVLLIGPWRQTLDLAGRLRQEFRKWTGENPNITISAGVALIKGNEPLNRAVRQAEERLESAKDAGRDRVGAVDREPHTWETFAGQMELGERLCKYLRDGSVSQGLAYRVLYFDEQRRLAEGMKKAAAPGEKLGEDGKKFDLGAASWRARWGYTLARHLPGRGEQGEEREVALFLNQLLGLDEHLQGRAGKAISPRTAVSIAVYRNRKRKE